MPPKKATSASTTSSTTSLGLSSFHERRRILEEEHLWLLKQIKRKRTELKNFLEQMGSIATEIVQRISPIYQQLIQLDDEIHGLFEEILTTRKFGKKTHKDVIGIYHSLQMMGLLSPKFDEDDDEFDDDDDEIFPDSSSDEFNPEAHEDFFNQNRRASHHSPSDELFTNSPPKSTQSQHIRQTFLKLASMFHPDKVTDSETQTYHNEIMKELNRAYEEGDIARLLEIERQHHLQQEIDLNNTNKSEIERLCLQREKDNGLLKTQYENLKRELRTARNSPEGEIVKEYRAYQREGIDPIGEMLFSIEFQVKQIENIRNFVQDFRDKKIPIKEFLKGPTPTRKAEEVPEEILEMMLGELLGIKF